MNPFTQLSASSIEARHLVTGLAIVAFALSLFHLLSDRAGVERWHAEVGSTPVTVYQPEGMQEQAPAVLVSHGFAGSRQMMEGFALTMAQNGYIAVSFDYLGHGRHPEPLYGELGEWDGAAAVLMEQTRQVMEFARDLPNSDGRIAVLGHSLGSGLMARFAQLNEDVDATVGISLFAPKTDEQTPKNLLSVVGGFENRLKIQGQELVAMVTDDHEPDDIRPGQTYGSFDDGTARRLEVIRGIEHVGILFSSRSADQARLWLDEVFDRSGEGFKLSSGGWIALLFASLVVLAYRLAAVLPVVSSPARGASASWKKLLLVAGAPALATPILLAPLPTEFLPVVVGDYLAVHFAVYGTLMLVALWWYSGWQAPSQWYATIGADPKRLIVATALLLFFCLGVIGWALEQFITSFYPVSERLPLLAVMFIGTLPFFLADEWLTRGDGAKRGAYPLTKLLFLVSLGIAVALDYESLSFLPMILPVWIIFFILYGLFSRWSFRRTGNPLVAGIVNAVAFAWALAVTFPMYAGVSPP
ncbi:alpha/beta hydrolase [Halorhodospira halochloris]|uniref:alpha/beta hydrolase n=1 Tax=Halorhodospira halochloris TaxID=1052 RepID=UPI001EE78911|nr:alpha/beta fold hydrolase [Halorhodospira halochloris]MCG5548072.1 alpha/beta hydrolase [Halorhodospira halochloris]